MLYDIKNEKILIFSIRYATKIFFSREKPLGVTPRSLEIIFMFLDKFEVIDICSNTP